jgi:hypothetical protein
VFLLERYGESVDDGTQDLQQLPYTIVSEGGEGERGEREGGRRRERRCGKLGGREEQTKNK